ncbi:IS630 family transposase [Spirosoma luteum]|nr:IS630 family transposase [Spirosoma luteum]
MKRDQLEANAVFYYADEFNLSWQPTLRAMWSPVGRQVMIPTPGQTNKRFGIGAVNYHTGETVVIVRKRKRREQITELLEQLLLRHPVQTIYVAWDNADTHSGGEIDAVVRGAAGRLVLLYLPTYSPWLNPIEMLWRHWRREVTHCELFESIKKLIEATNNFFARYNQAPEKVLSIIGATRQVFLDCT